MRATLHDQRAPLSTIVDNKRVLAVFLPFARGVFKAAMVLEVGCGSSYRNAIHESLVLSIVLVWVRNPITKIVLHLAN